MMYLHHLVTIALLLLSYSWGYLRIGAMVLLWRDGRSQIRAGRASPLEKRHMGPPGGVEAPVAPVHFRSAVPAAQKLAAASGARRRPS